VKDLLFKLQAQNKVKAVKQRYGNISNASVVCNSSATITSVSGTVQYKSYGTSTWRTASAGQNLSVRDQIRTARGSSASLSLPTGNSMNMSQYSTVEIQPPASRVIKKTLRFKSGASYFFSSSDNGTSRFSTPTNSSAIRG
tara:strand:- start:6079 stop:6501 length:423 start_codon:yes stop_codon:yes gene_type:complete